MSADGKVLDAAQIERGVLCRSNDVLLQDLDILCGDEPRKKADVRLQKMKPMGHL